MRDSQEERDSQGPLMDLRRSDQRGKIKGTAFTNTKNGTKISSQTSSTPVPPDGGWGWLLAFGTTACTMILMTQGPCFGILFGPRLRELNAPPSLASWIFSFLSMMWNLAGPWTGPLAARFSYRKVGLVAALLPASGLLISSQVTSPYLLLLTFSAFAGIGGGLTVTCCFHMTAQYFRDRLGIANSIMMTGASLGIMLLPQLASYLQHLYPFTWATLITGAVTLHAAVATLLFHPVEWHSKKTCPDEEVPPLLLEASPGTNGFKPRGGSVPSGLMLQGGANKELHLSKRIRAYSECQWNSPVERYSMGSMTLGSTTLMGSIIMPSCQEVEGEEVGIWQQFRNHYKPSVVRDPLVISVAVVNCFTLVSALNLFSLIPFVLHEFGYTLQESATAMSLAAVVDLVTRIGSGFITDLPQFKPRVLFGFGQIIFIATPFALLTWSDQWFAVLVCAGAFGMGFGVLYVLDVLIMIQLLGADRFQSVLGISQLLRSVAFISIGPVGGAIREASGSYRATLAFLSCCMLVAFLLMLSTAVILRPKQQSKKVVETIG